MASERFTLALAPLNPTVGDLVGNLQLLRAARAEAARQGADLLLTPELAVTGYPPEDLVLKPLFQDAVQEAVHTLAADDGPDMLLGTPWRTADGRLTNAVALITDRRLEALTHKHDLPNYGPFDEKRVFTAGPLPEPILWCGIRLGVPICEDLWTPPVCQHLAAQGAEILLVPNGSPYEYRKDDVRTNLVRQRTQETGLPLVYLNQLGGQDELVFDGGALIADATGTLAGRAPRWQDGLFTVTFTRQGNGWQIANAPQATEACGEAEIYAALVTGLRDYVCKNGFPGVLLGLSGGIDSALTAALAVDALGASRVRTVMMPSPYTAPASLTDAAACAQALGCAYETRPIGPIMTAFDTLLDHPRGVTAENIQARARGMILMALSNASGWMVLSTGNKSELSVGYATLYGDMCGGFSVLKDVYKTTVYALSRWRNAQPGGPVIPDRIITRAPSAELRPDQTDQDSLPPYDILDGLLRGLVERDCSVADLVREGFDHGTAQTVWQQLLTAEYKRRQAAPGVKITPRAFGRDRRYPITNGFRKG